MTYMSDIRLFSINFLQQFKTIFNSKMSWMWRQTIKNLLILNIILIYTLKKRIDLSHIKQEALCIAHVKSLNEICDGTYLHKKELTRICNITFPKRNTLTNENRTRNPVAAEELY